MRRLQRKPHERTQVKLVSNLKEVSHTSGMPYLKLVTELIGKRAESEISHVHQDQ